MYFFLKGKYSDYRVLIDEIDMDLAGVGFTGRYGKTYNPPQIVPHFVHKVNNRKRTFMLSRIVLERKLGRSLVDGEQAEHKNRSTLDNRRLNLRVASRSQNLANRPPQKNSTSGYKGVFWHKRDCKWHVHIQKDRKNRHLGCFTDKIEAAMVYDAAARELFGEFAWLNFPDKI